MYKASAPGSLMLMGEHAVLHGKLALVCALDKRMIVTLEPRADNKIQITSALGSFTTKLSQLNITPPFQFVLATLKTFQKQMPSGCSIAITSQFSDKIGFASSAAVTVSLIATLAAWLNVSLSPLDMIHTAIKIVRQVQGLGSGADVAACVIGGIIAYKASPLSIEKLPYSYPLTIVYSGSKTPTVEVVKHVEKYFKSQPALFEQVCQLIGLCSEQARKAICSENWIEVGKIMTIHQGLMDALQVNTPQLATIIQALMSFPSILGAKISGSGLGDCVVGLGSLENKKIEGLIPVAITNEGVVCEKI